MHLLFAIATCLGALSLLAEAISPISIAGSKFFDSNGNQFFIKGIAYQLIESDPLVNGQQCQLDAASMKQLGANTIRVYHVNASADHTDCMNTFADNGIYVLVDLDTFYTYIRQGNVSTWNMTQADSYRAVMDNFQQFDNTLGFYVGNEVLNSQADSGAAPYLLAAAVDLKAYSKAKGYRDIPIGYSATDTSDLRPMLQDYLACRPNATERLDFYSLNSYEWCGQSTYTQSGYDVLQNMSVGYPIPIFFSEDGCNTVPPRTFDDQAAIFGPEMVNTWSGSIIYEWIEETNNYGLIQYGPAQAADVNIGSSVVQGFTRQGTPTPVLPDYTNLQSQWATLTPTGVNSAAYVKTLTTTAPTCPPSSGRWTVNPTAALPTLGAAAVSGTTPESSSSVPPGHVTVSHSNGPAYSNATTPTPSRSTGSLPSTGSDSSASTSSSSSSHTATAGAERTAGSLIPSIPLGKSIIPAFIALASMFLGAILLL